jgi:conjugal transfer ATP-binding protein TraC
LNPCSAPVTRVPQIGAGHTSHQEITARSLLARSACQNRFDSFLIDGVYHKAVNLLLLPEFLDFSHMDALASELWPDYDLALTIHAVNSERLIARLKASGNVAKALSFSNFGGHYEATQKFAELDEMIREVRASTQKLFTSSFCVLFKGKDPQEVEDQAQSGLKAFQELGSAGGLIDNLLHEDLFLSFLPNHGHSNSRQHVMNTEPLAQIVPLQAPWYGTNVPKMLFENPQGELVSLDVFDPSLPAKHAVLVGTTGSGKSFTCNYLLTHFFIESPLNHVVIIDIGGSYRKLCQLFGGQYLNVELSDRFAFNPLPPKGSLFDGKEYDPDEIAYLTLILQRMVLDENEALNSLGETILEKAVKQAYQALPADQAPLLRDVRRALGETTGDEETVMLAQHYFKNLEMWAEGRYAKIFNSAKRLEIDNRMIVFDLERLGHHPRLQSVFFYVIREIIDAKLRDKALRKMIVIDEGWRFFNDEIGSRLIENLYRTARKSNGMVLSISQSPVDFLSTKAANAIISNSYVKYILRLTKGHDLLPQFGFTSTEIEAIKALSSVPRKYSDLYLKFNEHGTVIRVEPSPLDYWICTTDPEDAMKESALRHEHPGWSHAQVLEALAQGGTQ